MKICSVIDCSAQVLAKKLCARHYHRMRNTGSLQKPIRSRSEAERFDAKFVKRMVNDCWEWQAQLTPDGYGRFRFSFGQLAHRYAFYREHGYLPGKNRHVMHLCDNRKCVNPAHLVDGTHQENMADMVAKGRANKPTHNKGEKNYNARLTNAQAAELYMSLKSYKELAQMYGIPYHSVLDIKSGRRYRDATEHLERPH